MSIKKSSGDFQFPYSSDGNGEDEQVLSSRREILLSSGAGFGALALAGSLDEEFDLPDIEGFIETTRNPLWENSSRDVN